MLGTNPVGNCPCIAIRRGVIPKCGYTRAHPQVSDNWKIVQKSLHLEGVRGCGDPFKMLIKVAMLEMAQTSHKSI